MDSTIKLGILSTLLGVAAATVDAVPVAQAPARHRGKFGSGKTKKAGCTPCQAQADAREILRDSARTVGMPMKNAVPR